MSLRSRFVILFHSIRETSQETIASVADRHWDLMLETNDGLATWQLEAKPKSGLIVRARKLAIHRAVYLEFEGRLSGNRGCVSRIEQGYYTAEQHDIDDLDSTDAAHSQSRSFASASHRLEIIPDRDIPFVIHLIGETDQWRARFEPLTREKWRIQFESFS